MVDGGTRGLTEPEPAWQARLHGLAQPDYLAAARTAVEQMFLPGDDVARRSWIMEQMLATPST